MHTKNLAGIVAGFLATVMQHEFDHLDGRLYIDHICNLAHVRRGVATPSRRKLKGLLQKHLISRVVLFWPKR